MARSEPLILHYEDLDRRTENFFASLRRSPERFGRFAANPAGEITQSLFDGRAKLPAQEIDRANRVVFALLSNPRFIAWARDYQRLLVKEIGRKALSAPTRRDAKRTLFQMLGKRRIFLDFAKGMKEFGDEELFYAMGLKARNVEFGGIFEPGSEFDVTVFLIQSVVVFVQTIIVVDQGLAVHQDAVTENRADAHGVSHVDVFFINDHVAFTTHDFFFDHSAHTDTDSQASVSADSAADSSSESDVATEAGSDAAGSDSASEAGSEAGSESGASSDARADAGSASDASSDAGSEASADSGSESSADSGSGADHGAEADASAFGRLFGMSRWELQQFAAVVAQAVSMHADRLRAAGALTSAESLNRTER